MIKRVKGLDDNALINQDNFRHYVESFESEILRGIGTLSVLNIIRRHGDEGTYGYELLKELEQSTNSLLVIEEGTLYPILKKLENWGPADKKIKLVEADRRKIGGRSRKYYRLTEDGKRIYSHLEGFFSKLIESMSSLLDYKIQLNETGYVFCPNCANKIDTKDNTTNYCEMCGLNIQEIKDRRLTK